MSGKLTVQGIDLTVKGWSVPVTDELLADRCDVGRIVMDMTARYLDEALLDLIHGPRYGPPAPRVYVEPARCPTCGHEIDDWDGD